jgi:hypothetical protein
MFLVKIGKNIVGGFFIGSFFLWPLVWIRIYISYSMYFACLAASIGWGSYKLAVMYNKGLIKQEMYPTIFGIFSYIGFIVYSMK